jgi:hypothetical protein
MNACQGHCGGPGRQVRPLVGFTHHVEGLRGRRAAAPDGVKGRAFGPRPRASAGRPIPGLPRTSRKKLPIDLVLSGSTARTLVCSVAAAALPLSPLRHFLNYFNPIGSYFVERRRLPKPSGKIRLISMV